MKVLTAIILIFLTTIQPAMADLIYNYLASLAIKNGMVMPNPAYNKVSAGRVNPNYTQAIQAIRQLPAREKFSNQTHIPDPSPAELGFIQPGATNADGVFLPEPVEGYLFGQFNPQSIDKYGIATYQDESFDLLDDISSAAIPDPLIPNPDLEDDFIDNPDYAQYLLDIGYEPVGLAYAEKLYCPKVKTTVEIKEISLILPKDSIVYVEATNRNISIRSYTDIIRIKCGNMVLDLNPGEELLAGKGLRISRFSLLRSLPASIKQDKRKLNKIMKTAAALLVINRKKV